jgi:outer membrane protein
MIVDVDQSKTTKIKNDLILNVVVDYLQVLTNQDLVTAARRQKNIAEQNLDKSQIMLKAGNQTLADLSEAKAQVSTATLNLTTAQNQLNLSVLILKQYMEMEPNAPIIIDRPDVSTLNDVKIAYDPNDVVKIALTINSDALLAELQQKTNKQAIEIAKRYHLPTVALYTGSASSYSNQLNQHVIGENVIAQQIGTVQVTNQSVVTKHAQPI